MAALAAQGRRALGIDVSEAAVARTVWLGRRALRRSVFEALPGEGHWDTALLRYARQAGRRRDAQWAAGGRSFVALRNRSDRADLRERSTSSTAEPPNNTAVTSSQRARKPSPDRPVSER